MKRTMLTVIVCACLTVPAVADMTYYFGNITNSSGLADDMTLAKQLSVVVSPVADAPTQVSFTFFNSAATSSDVAEIYFEDGTLLGMVSIANAGTTFREGSEPKWLPAGENLDPAWRKSRNFSADVDVGQETDPLDAGTDSVEFIFDLLDGQEYDDVIAAIVAGLEPGPWVGDSSRLRMGLHVRSIGGTGESDSFSIVVPVPGAVLLGMLGLGAAGLGLRRIV
ncbi:MAG: hypothetical protein ABFD90_02780 [Phycisphaerales bacterium]